MVLLLLIVMAIHVQSTRNNKLAISLQYFKKEVIDKYDFLHEDKYQSFLQDGSIVFTYYSQACPKHPKQQVCNICRISHKKRRDEVDCLHVDKHKTILQVHKINLQSFAKYLRLTFVLLFSCDIEHYGESSISVFQEIVTSTDKSFISGTGLSTRQ